MKVLRVKDWNNCFENASSRKLKSPLPWVAVPTKHDGKGYRKLMRHESGAAFYGVWILLVAVAAKSKVRGYLVDDDGPLSDEDISIKTDAPSGLIGQTIAHLVDVIGWMEWVEVDSISSLSADDPSALADGANALADGANALGKPADTRRTEQNMTCSTDTTDGHNGSVPSRNGHLEGRSPDPKPDPSQPKTRKKNPNSVFIKVERLTLENPHCLRRWFLWQADQKGKVLDPLDPDDWRFCIGAAAQALDEGDNPPALFTTIIGTGNRDCIRDKHKQHVIAISREFPITNGAVA